MATRRKKKTEEPAEVVEAAPAAADGFDEVSEGSAPSSASDRVVVFFLEGQRYALPIGRVQEIQQIVAHTDVPDESGTILGMVNLRGIVVPLIDMRSLLGMPAAEYTLNTPMIVCRLRGQLVAAVVDEVEDVAMMPEGCMQEPSKLHRLAQMMLGVCRMGSGLVFLLDLDRLIPEEEFVPAEGDGGGASE